MHNRFGLRHGIILSTIIQLRTDQNGGRTDGMLDLKIKNGTVFDPGAGWKRNCDIGIAGGRITETGALDQEEAAREIDASGCLITPGLIDFHAHAAYGVSDFAMPADLIQIPNGVTSMTDAGSTGAANFEAFYRHNVVSSVLTIKSMLNVSSMGQVTHRFNENLEPENFDRDRIAMLCEKYKDQIIGLKLRQSRDIVGDLGLRPLEESVRLGDELGLRLSVHITDSPGEVKDTLDRMRPGDLFCHMFHQKGKTILDENGKVLPEIHEAREKGILFELGHGAFNFSGVVAKHAIDQGFLPDVISSDLSMLSACKAPTFGFGYIISELLNLGMTFEDILYRCTTVPAGLMGIRNTGFFDKGERADIAIMRIIDHPVHYQDRYGNRYEGTKLIKNEATIKDGIVLYRAFDFFS